jgi:hypothetical protein
MTPGVGWGGGWGGGENIAGENIFSRLTRRWRLAAGLPGGFIRVRIGPFGDLACQPDQGPVRLCWDARYEDQ